jgi:GNAT superfamily N-acetyltransferase
VNVPETWDEYLEVRRLTSKVFGSGKSAYDPESDFYNAPEIMTCVAGVERGQVISAASILIVEGIANVWSVCTDENARGRGVASAVVHACLLEAHRQGAHAAVLGTSLELAKTDGLYNRLGFETVGHEHGWTIDEGALRSL